MALPAQAGKQLIQAVEDSGAEAAVVLRQVINWRGRLRRAVRTIGGFGRAIEIGTALDLEAEIHGGELRVEARHDGCDFERILIGLSGGIYQAQAVGGKISGLVGADDENVILVGQGADDRQQRENVGWLGCVNCRGLDNPIYRDIR